MLGSGKLRPVSRKSAAREVLLSEKHTYLKQKKKY